MSGNRNKRYRATRPALACVTAMKRQSSNRVKMLKIDASATKQTTKLSASERSNVASIRLGKPSVPTPYDARRRGAATDLSALVALLFGSHAENENGTRLSSNRIKLKPTMNTVASHGPMYEIGRAHV